MNKETILKKAIEKAEKNGYEDAYKIDTDEDMICYLVYEAVIFDHSFCKAFWGEVREVEDDNGRFVELEKGWEYHIQQLALSEDRLEYIGRFL